MTDTSARTGKIPATVITGFLGSGKTTLIRHLIENAGGRRIALIINEFGDVGVDGEILKGCGVESCREDDIIELANGCICCTVADDFLPTMQALIERDIPPDHIVIETSGLALPKPLVQAFNWPEVRTRVTVDGVVTLVDADAVAQGRFAHDEDALSAQRAADEMLDHDSPLEELFEDQLHCADMVVLTKADLVSPDVLEDVRRNLTAHTRPGVYFVQAERGNLPADTLLGLGIAAENGIEHRHSHHDAEGEDHDHDDFDSFVASMESVPSAEVLAQRIAALAKAEEVYRVKGFVPVEGRDMRLLVQAVGPRVNWHFDRAWKEAEPRAGRLVVIGASGFNRANAERILKGG
ncbi:cobalamin biosynthesis protein CobW [Hyphomonas sp. NPDC076900]|uniref:cobalamin biosynthesis protein CobW n=1 Tax=unclassified Hyphomonas TaxID=2630699 RepID=UPI003D06FEC7